MHQFITYWADLHMPGTQLQHLIHHVVHYVAFTGIPSVHYINTRSQPSKHVRSACLLSSHAVRSHTWRTQGRELLIDDYFLPATTLYPASTLQLHLHLKLATSHLTLYQDTPELIQDPTNITMSYINPMIMSFLAALLASLTIASPIQHLEHLSDTDLSLQPRSRPCRRLDQQRVP